MLERFGFAPAPGEWRAAAAAISGWAPGRETGATLLRRNKNGREVWLVRVRGVAVAAVWAPDEGIIISVLPNGLAGGGMGIARKRAGSGQYAGRRRPEKRWRPDEEQYAD
ncbi:MAG: hypothetical protein KGI71_04645 [Patescibacteria group bacterium]|nr:hypothetical protein [Patescibacteria group bacterium]